LIDGLSRIFPEQTDLKVLIAERAAQSGEHKKAIQYFTAVANLGLPRLSSGLAYMVDRLRFYSEASNIFTGIQVSNWNSFAPSKSNVDFQLSTIQRFAIRCDFELPFSNYTGYSPEQPDDVDLAENIVSTAAAPFFV
jgi:hypothetical protein